MPVLLVGSINIATAQDRRDALEALQRERLQALRGAQARSAPQWQPTAAALAWLPPVDGETPCFAIQDFELVRETPHLPHDCGDRFSCLLQDLGAFVAPAWARKAWMPCLVECGTHAVVAASIGPYAFSEVAMARQLLPAKLTGDMLVMADRNFYSFKLWQAVCASGAKLLWRVKSNLGLHFSLAGAPCQSRGAHQAARAWRANRPVARQAGGVQVLRHAVSRLVALSVPTDLTLKLRRSRLCQRQRHAGPVWPRRALLSGVLSWLGHAAVLYFEKYRNDQPARAAGASPRRSA